MDEFDQAAAQVLQDSDPMDLAAAQVADDQRSQTRASLYSSLLENPDVAARATALGKRAGLPRDVVQRNMPEVERRVQMDEYDRVLQDSPALAQWLADQDNAAIAHDDIGNMGAIERKLRQFGGGIVRDAWGRTVSGVGELGNILQRMAVNDFASIFLPEPKRGPMGLEPQRPTIESLAGPLIGEGWQGAGQLIKDQGTAIAGTGEQTFGDQVAGGLGQVVGQIAMLPLVGPLSLYTQGADVMAEKVRGDQVDQRTKDLAVLGGAAVTGVTEAWALDKLLGPMATPIKNQVGAALARIGIASAAEGAQEFSENVLQDVIRKALTNRDAEIDLGQSVEEGGVGAVVGGIVRTVVESALHIRTRGVKKVQQAEQDGQNIAELNDLAKADKLLARDPESFQAFINQAAQDGPVDTVYIDAKTLMQSGLAEQVAQVSPAVAEQLEIAAQTGAQIAIPVGEYTARIAPTDFAQGLLEHLKTDPDGFTMAEAREYQQSGADQQFQQDAERALAEKEGDTLFNASRDAVQMKIQQELDALGRFTPEKNAADAVLFASYYATRAAQLGVMPEALYQQRRVNFAAQRLDGDVLNQGPIADLTGEEIAPASADVPVLRDAAKAWYAQNLRGKTVTNAASGRAVQFAGARKAFHASANPEKLRLFAALPAIVENGVIESSRPPVDPGREPSTKAYHWLTATVNMGGKPVRVGVTLREDQAGNLYYNHNPIPAKEKAPDPETRSGPAHKAGAGESEGGAFDQSVRQPDDGINLEVLNQQARGSFSPDSLTISLLKGADLSTALHEGAHFFFENDIALASEIVSANAVFDPETMGEGERQIVADVATLLRWNGITGTVQEQLATWHQMDFEARRAAHERTAESFERYLFEGNAPSVELASYFRKFRAWMVNVYKSIKDFLARNPEAGKLDDTVRQVFDRMLATAEQIKLAEQGRSMLPIFATPEQAGMTVEEFAAYQEQGAAATAEAIHNLEARSLRDLAWARNARGREIKKLQKQAEGLRRDARMEARREVMSQPVYQAWQFLTAKEEGGKLYLNPADPSITPEVRESLDSLKMTSKDGAAPDIVAEQFGFTSGDEMINALLASDPPDVAIDVLTDRMMLERHGELATPEAIEQAADQAIHNEARARMVATEANALAQAAGQRKVLVDAAKQFAAQVVARLNVRDLRPSRFTNAAARAAQNAEKASRAGDIATAAAEKRNQLVQTLAAKATHDARDEVDSGVKYLRKFERKGVRENLDTGYLEQIDALLDRYDLVLSASGADRRASLRTWVQSRLNAGEIPAISESLLTPQERAAYLAEVQSRDADGELVYKDDEDAIKLLAEAIDRSAQRSYKDMTVEEFRGLMDTVRNIEHLARLKNKLLSQREERAYEAVRDEMAAAIAENARQSGKNTKTANDWLGQKLQSIKDFGAAHIKVATWARIMDGGKDNGPVWRYLVQPANERANMETTMRAEATARLSAILDPILKDVSASDKWGKGRHFPTLGRALNWQERFAVALNVGNESNLQRLLGGDGWTYAQILPVLNSLSAREWQAVQAVWDHFETYRPLIAAKEKRVTGTEPEWIQARPITVATADGQTVTLPGGYFPVVFDPRVNMKAEADSKSQEFKDLAKAAYSAATTRRGFTKQRVNELKGRPLMLSLQGMYSAFDAVIHDLAWHEWVIDANKLLKSKTIDNAIREHYGPEVKRQFETWRDDIVMGQRKLGHQTEKAVSLVRQSVSASALTFNLLTAAQQPLGIANSVARVGAKWIGRGVARYAAAPFESTSEAMEKSSWLRNRTRTRFRDLNELRNQVQGQTAVKELMGRYGYWLMMRTQLMVDVPTWWGAYEKAIADGQDEATAVQLADQATKDAQGGGEDVDLAAIERGNALTKVFTTFYSYMGSTLNVAYLAAKTDSSRARAVANILLVTMTPAILGALLKDALTPGGDDDEEELTRKLVAEQISFLLGMIVVGREFAQAGKMLVGDGGMSYGGPAGLRAFGEATKLAQQLRQGEFDAAFLRSFVSTMGMLTGLPAVQINRAIQGAIAIEEGEVEGPVESAAALAFGYQR